MSVPHARSGHPRRAAVGAVHVLGPSLRHAVRVAWAVQHARLVANCIDAWRRGVIFFLCAGVDVGRGGASGERRLSKVRLIVNRRADSNEKAHHARPVS